MKNQNLCLLLKMIILQNVEDWRFGEEHPYLWPIVRQMCTIPKHFDLYAMIVFGILFYFISVTDILLYPGCSLCII